MFNAIIGMKYTNSIIGFFVSEVADIYEPWGLKWEIFW